MAGLAPPPFTLRQLQYAVAVADTLSFRQAARRCRVSQPSLSAQLAQLEEALGVRLFERDRRRVLITAAGEELCGRARRLLVEAQDLTEAARRFSDPLAGTLRVGVIPTVSPYLLPRLAPAIRRRHPGLTVRWMEDKTAALLEALGAGELDAALLALDQRTAADELEHEVIAVDPFVLATPAGHPLGKRRAPARLAELEAAEVLLLDEGHCLREQALAVCDQVQARELDFRATSLSTLAQMVAAGAGVTLLPALAVPTETRRAELALRPFAAPAPHRTLGLVWRKRSPMGAAFRELARTMRRAYPAERAATARGLDVPRRSM